MAGLKVAFVTGAVAVTTTPATVLMITAGANAGLQLKNMIIGVDGTSPTEGKLQVEIVRKFTAGTGTGTTITPQKVSGHSGSIQATAKKAFSVEPTSGGSTVVVWDNNVHPQGNIAIPLDILVDAGETVGFRVTSPTGKNVRLTVNAEE